MNAELKSQFDALGRYGLSEQIAELKGWEQGSDGRWRHPDVKLERRDPPPYHSNDRLASELRKEMASPTFTMTFSEDGCIIKGCGFHAFAPTEAEATCRAYLKFMEWQ